MPQARFSRIIAAVLLATLAACASTAQKGALIGVQKAIAKKKFDACLDKLDRADNYGNVSATQSAQISFYRGTCLDGIGRKAEAAAVYQNLVNRFPGTDWAAQARARLAASH